MEQKNIIFAVAGLLVVSLFGFSILFEDSPNSDVDWQEVEMTEVDSGEEFTIEELEAPVLVETFAVWCPTCTRQQQEKQSLKEERSDFTSVTINTDPNEDAAEVSQHKADHGFEWRYSVASTEVSNSLREEFGSTVLNAPSAPMIVVCEDGSTEFLPTGLKPADNLSNHLDESC